MNVRPPRPAPPVSQETREAFDRVAPPRYSPPAAPPANAHHEQPHEGAASVAALRARLASKTAPASAEQPQRGPDVGRILARVSRHDGTELRVSLHTYNARLFVQVGPWQSSDDDAWPVRGKMTTVRRAEVAAVVAGLLDALDAMDAAPPARAARG